MTSKTSTSIIPFSGFRSWWSNIRPSLSCPCTIDGQFSRPEQLLFPLVASRPTGNIHTQNVSWNDFSGPSRQVLPLPSSVSLSYACSFLRPLLPSSCYAGYLGGYSFPASFYQVCNMITWWFDRSSSYLTAVNKGSMGYQM